LDYHSPFVGGAIDIEGPLMDILQLEHFLAVAEDGSFTRAAQRMCRTQPAISQSIKKLEEELGSALFTRDLHDVSLTDAGRSLVGYARKMIAMRNQATRTVGSLKHTSTSAMNIAAHESAAVYLLPTALRHYLHTFPDARVGIYRSRLVDIPRQVLDRNMHIGFIKDECAFKELTCVPVHADEMMLVASPHNDLVRRGVRSFRELHDVPFVLHRLCSSTEQKILRLFGEQQVRCRIVAEVGSFDSIKSLVKEDVGFAIVPGVTVKQELAAGTLVRLKLPEINMPRQTFMIYRDAGHQSNPARALIDIVRDFTCQLPAAPILRAIRRPA
jgi:DNA-binding transcriptional LysR family regulator